MRDVRKFIGPPAAIAMLAAFLAASQSAFAAVFGLAIGIDDYGGKDDLRGAVADAQDVAAALRNNGAKKIITLFNSEARRKTILESYQSLVAEAKQGDTLIVHYAGHGAQEPLIPGDSDPEGDRKNEVFVLGGFRTLKDQSERILDKEVSTLLAQAGRKGVKVLFVADSCHSGGMNRTVNSGVRVRKLEISLSGADSISRSAAAPARGDPGLSNVTFLAAVPRNQESPEIVIDGKPRGALSWTFARALEGGIPLQNANWISAAQLYRYVVPTVIALTEGQQVPQFMPSPPSSARLVEIAARAELRKPGAVQMSARRTRAIETAPSVTLAITGAITGTTTGGDMPGQTYAHASIVDLKQAPLLVWDRSRKRLEHRVGGVVAENVEDYDIAPMVAKWAAIEIVKQAMGQGAPEAILKDGPVTYRRGKPVEIRISGAEHPYLTLFNLPPNGRVELLYPSPSSGGEAKADWRGRTVEQKFVVDRPPFGAEHLVVLFSAEPLTSLHVSLEKMNDREISVGLPVVLQEALSMHKVQTGLLPIYTAP